MMYRWHGKDRQVRLTALQRRMSKNCNTTVFNNFIVIISKLKKKNQSQKCFSLGDGLQKMP